MATGTVKWFNPQNGYGAIVPDDAGKEVAVRLSANDRAVVGVLKDGQRVTYETEAQNGRMTATSVQLA